MLAETKLIKECTALSESVQLLDASVLPSTAVLSGFASTFERELQRRGLLEVDSALNSPPLQFLLETEQNTFLWRRGLSLLDKDRFQFWVDLPKLVDKRLSQLSDFRSDNPFVNPLWGIEGVPEPVSVGEEYFLQLLEHFSKSCSHLHALSLASAEAFEEFNQPIVILPHCWARGEETPKADQSA